MSWTLFSEYVMDAFIQNMSWRLFSEIVMDTILRICHGRYFQNMSWTLFLEYVMDTIFRICHRRYFQNMLRMLFSENAMDTIFRIRHGRYFQNDVMNAIFGICHGRYFQNMSWTLFSEYVMDGNKCVDQTVSTLSIPATMDIDHTHVSCFSYGGADWQECAISMGDPMEYCKKSYIIQVNGELVSYLLQEILYHPS